MYSFKSFIYPVLAFILATAVTGCITNDIPYPHIQPNFLSFEVQDQLQAPGIDTLNRQIQVFLTEDADIENVVLYSYDLQPQETSWPDSVNFLNGINLSDPVYTTVTLYQDYVWRISAVQNIERYFTIENQVGEATIDVASRTVIAYVTAATNLSEVKVTSLKLGAPNAEVSPNINGKKVDFRHPVTVEVTQHNRTETWTIYVEKSQSEVTTDRVDAWSQIAWVYGTAEAGAQNGVEYRLSTSDQWIKVPEELITETQGSFCGQIRGLEPLTTYVARATSGKNHGQEIEFKTEAVVQLPNHDFENWWLNGKVWNPWAEGGEPYWDTGNKGATTLGQSNSVPDNDTPTGQGRCAKLQTKFVGIGKLGKLAAGNFFAGVYVRTDGTNGVLSFGRDFTLRPTRLEGWMKYHSAPISHATSGFEDMIGKPDSAIVWVALIDSPEPFEIRTKPSERHLFDPDGPEVIAYGKTMWGYDVPAWSKFEVKLNYKSTSRIPKYILVVSSASWLGDYFTGGNGSVLCIDDYILKYD